MGHASASRRAAAALAIAAAVMPASTATAQERGRNLVLVSVPAATVPPHGTGYLAFSGTTRSAFNPGTADGSFEFGLGLGDADAAVGVQMRVVVTSLLNNFGDAGYLGVKLSRRIAGGTMPVYAAVSADYIAPWGASATQPVVWRGMLTGFGALRAGDEMFPVVVTAGYGTNIVNGGRGDAAFAGFGIGLTETLGASAAWTGESLDIGFGIRPPGPAAPQVAVSLNDVFDQTGRQRVTVSVGWVFGNIFGG